MAADVLFFIPANFVTVLFLFFYRCENYIHYIISQFLNKTKWTKMRIIWLVYEINLFLWWSSLMIFCDDLLWWSSLIIFSDDGFYKISQMVSDGVNGWILQDFTNGEWRMNDSHASMLEMLLHLKILPWKPKKLLEKSMVKFIGAICMTIE